MARRIVMSLAGVLNLLLVDQFVKAFAIARLKSAQPIEVLSGFFDLTYVENRGCAWGMLQGHVWPLAAFALVAMAVLVVKRKTIFPEGGWGVAAELMLHAGIVGNLIDRLFRGCVVDMFDFHWGVHHFPVFNMADTYITLAAAILIFDGVFRRDSGRKPPPGSSADMK